MIAMAHEEKLVARNKGIADGNRKLLCETLLGKSGEKNILQKFFKPVAQSLRPDVGGRNSTKVAQEAGARHRGQGAPGRRERAPGGVDGEVDVGGVSVRHLDPGPCERGVDAGEITPVLGRYAVAPDPVVDPIAFVNSFIEQIASRNSGIAEQIDFLGLEHRSEEHFLDARPWASSATGPASITDAGAGAPPHN